MTFWQFNVAVITLLGYLITLALLPVVLLTKKQQTVSTVAWMMAIVAMPIVGAALFLIFGINHVKRRLRGRRESTLILSRAAPRWLSSHLQFNSQPLQPIYRSMMQLCHQVGGTRPTIGNQVLLLSETELAFREIETAIAAAQSSVHLEYYIWQPDRIGTRVRDMLMARAKAGVTVRFLYDSLGSMRLTSRFLQPMRDAGIWIASFVPGQTFRERWSINLRSHRKIIVVDGRIGFTGGMNVGDEYLGKSRHFGYWRDTHIRLEGPTVLQLQDVFAMDWKYATGEELTQPELYPLPSTRGNVLAQVIAGGPDQEDALHKVVFTAINEARSHVLLETCYFVPPYSLVSAMETAAQRGVRVRLLVSGRVVYWYTHFAGRSYYDSLLEAGVEIYEYQRGQLHAKTVSVDGLWGFVGTPNLDARSMFLNFEVGVALYDSAVAERLEADFERDLADAHRIDPETWPERGTWPKVRENFCRMFSPIL